jgi:REP element-mobilizing transposase RayT
MPRTARLDIPGILHHVIVRGIERSPIFVDDNDRQSFTIRLAKLLAETGTECLAWALLDNHIHLLLRPQNAKLATFMRRLLTGHAITFNLRHKRSGHLFQNRYKSIVCEEESYLLELVRYIHLNPLRAGIVADMAQLDFFPWSGHAVIMGNMTMSEQNTHEILLRFGNTIEMSRQMYWQFVADGILQGRRDDLVGGGLKRSQPDSITTGDVDAYDARILGSGAFVDNLLSEYGCSVPKKQISLLVLADKVADACGLSSELLSQRVRTKNVSEARSVFCYSAIHNMGYSGAEVAEFLCQSRAGVSISTRRGAALLASDTKLKMQINGWLEI